MIIRRKITPRRDLTLIVPDGLGFEVEMYGDTVELKASLPPTPSYSEFLKSVRTQHHEDSCPLTGLSAEVKQAVKSATHEVKRLGKKLSGK